MIVWRCWSDLQDLQTASAGEIRLPAGRIQADPKVDTASRAPPNARAVQLTPDGPCIFKQRATIAFQLEGWRTGLWK